MLVQNIRVLEETKQRKDIDGFHTEYVTDFIFRDGIKPLYLYVIEHPLHRKEVLTMAEYISCRSCDSPSCKGCNIYTLSTMLNKGKFDSLMNDNRSINPTADVAEVKHAEWVLEYGTYGRMICSLCKEEALANDFNEYVDSDFCPHCGAKMDKKRTYIT